MSTTKSRACLRKTTRRSTKSYKDPDTESEAECNTPPPRRSLPIRASKALRGAYGLDDSASDPSSTSDEEEALVQLVPRATRNATVSKPLKRKSRATAFRGAYDVDESGETSFDSSGEDVHDRLRRQHTRSSTSKRKTRVSEHQPSKLNFKKRKIITPETHMTNKSGGDSITFMHGGRIPEWPTLPYHVLLKIMRYASYPFYTNASRDTGSARWLLNTSQLCRTFHDACIGALMYSPPLFPAHRAHWLIGLLKASARDHGHGHGDKSTRQALQSSTKTSTDYRTKLNSLEIEVKQVLVSKAGIDLTDVLKHTPLLKHLRLYHNNDTLSDRYTWAQPSAARGSSRWSYGNLFDVLDQNSIQLHSFEWNGRFLGEDPLLNQLRDVSCDSRALRSLRSVTLINLDLPDIEKLNEIVAGDNFHLHEESPEVASKSGRLLTWRNHVLQALNALPELRDLTILSSNIIDDTVIRELPISLRNLTVVRCAYVKNEGVQSYLEDKGSHLTSLCLQANQSMCLGFLHHLKTYAPRLENLDIDLTFRDPTSFKDTEPLFDELLPDGSPTWPSELHSISIGPLRNLSAEDAENFYQSLVDAAPKLHYLRNLQLRTLLNKVSWRDRAMLRQKWDAKLIHTFSVKCNEEIYMTCMHTNKVDSYTSGRKTRQASDSEEDEPPEVGKGRCDTVLFELSDQRPAQDQYTEGDFLDDDDLDAEDGDWDGRDEIEPPQYSRRRYAF